ncbi:hypothetical protein [Glycomyces sp. MUSA5-2]|uniref:hypothetical protein n=1 Tax=Glycomyces sp. MUSA5-2 TaxID=2053002 RepID=UPI003008780A
MNRPNDTTGNHEPIPARMANLPRYGYLAVPWIVRWTMTAPPGDQIEYDPSLGDVAACDCIPGKGRPQFANLCYPRHRKAMTQRCCGQCGEKLGDRMFWIADNDSQTWTEPASHPECLAYAMRACPDLKRTLKEKPDLGVVEAPGYWLHAERSPNRVETGPWNYFPPGTPIILQQLIGGILFTYQAEPRAKTRHNAAAWLRQNEVERGNHKYPR